MNPELLAAVKERVALGHSKEAVYAALEAAGYNREQIDTVYGEAQAAQTGTPIPLADGQAGEQYAPGTTSALPSGWELFTGGWRYMRTRLDLVVLLAIPLLVFMVAEVLSSDEFAPVSVPLAIGSAVVVLIAMFVYVASIIALLRIVSESDAQRLSISDGLQWARSHWLGLVWVITLVTLVVVGGLFLLIIPGVIASLYLYLAQYVYVKEDVRGMAALLRSTQLVRDHWWALLWRLVVFGVSTLLVLIPVAIVAAIIGAIVTGGVYTEWAAEAGVQIASAVVAVMSVHAVYQLYRSLAVARPAGSTTELPAVWKYKALAFVGVLGMVLFAGLVGMAVQYEEELREATGFESEENEVDLEAAKLQLRELEASMEWELDGEEQVSN